MSKAITGYTDEIESGLGRPTLGRRADSALGAYERLVIVKVTKGITVIHYKL